MMIESVIHNSMIIRANATIPKSVVARIGITVSAVRIARRDPPVHRELQVRRGLLVLRVLPVKLVPLVRKVPLVSLALPVRKDLPV